MAARAMWKGVIRFGAVEVPVKLYSAVESKSSVQFRLLHEKDHEPVSQKMVHPETGEEVPWDDVRRGYEVSRGVFVMFDDEELEELEPEASRDIEITRFVDPAEIDHRWYERPYFLGPDGDAESYAALSEALGSKGKEGVARWVMRKKSYVGALREKDGHLMLMTLRHAEEVVSEKQLEAPGGRGMEARETKMANQLVEALAGEFDPSEYRDEYRQRVMELVETKAEGGEVKLKKFRRKKTDDEDLSNALKESLAKAKGKKSA